jgi:hypothetical protein
MFCTHPNPRLCPLGFSSPEGAQSEDQCYPVNVCPAGTGERQCRFTLFWCLLFWFPEAATDKSAES